MYPPARHPSVPPRGSSGIGANRRLTLWASSRKIGSAFVNDWFERNPNEAAVLVRANKRRTLGAREVQTAVRLVLPAELAKHARGEGTKSVAAVSGKK